MVDEEPSPEPGGASQKVLSSTAIGRPPLNSRTMRL
jgi:hypothetical protein